MDCSPPGFSVHGIFQARVLEWVAISFSRGSSRPRDQTQVSALQADALPSEPPGKPSVLPQASPKRTETRAAKSWKPKISRNSPLKPGHPLHLPRTVRRAHGHHALGPTLGNVTSSPMCSLHNFGGISLVFSPQTPHLPSALPPGGCRIQSPLVPPPPPPRRRPVTSHLDCNN
ncbi:unnamed protein product [Rangifer tarandus platyrhynchus]|uniref:Uncharacterized protein n=2 Tax=Rangifer tarandus platyrhynchus TaxID=3082113 RepID=A0AC59YK12_RANTA|nr:unnamed protein product [Rangifer tarandus platyrhynchus]